MPKVSELIVDSLVRASVHNIYGVPGDSLNAFTEVFRKRGEIRWVHMRHEEAAAFAAEGEAQLTGRLCACAGSCGPGNLHLINGLYDAQRTRVPIIAIAAQVPSSEMSSGYFQETRPDHLFADCSVYCGVITHPEQASFITNIAIQSAIGGPGVSVIVIPGDLAWLEVSEEPVYDFSAESPILTSSEDEIGRASQVINSAKKVTILAGAGCVNARDEVISLAGKLKAPIVHTIRGKELFEYQNPYDVGMTGLLGVSSGYYAMMDCDALLILGADFPYRQFYPKNCKVIQVDTRREQIGRRVGVDVAVVGSVKQVASRLESIVSEKHDIDHLKSSVEHYAKVRASLEAHATATQAKGTVRPQQLVKALSELASDDAVFTCDVGTPTLWAARYMDMNGKRRLIGSFSHGSMANALPQAIGAQLCSPGRQVVSLSGDGGLSMLMGELLTLVQYDLPVKVVVFNNGCLGFVELEMKAEGMLPYGTDLRNPNFAELARSVGMVGIRVDEPGMLVPCLTDFLNAKGPALIDVPLNRNELVMPPKLSLKELSGFGLYLVKAVLSGEGNQIIDLAKTSLFE